MDNTADKLNELEDSESLARIRKQSAEIMANTKFCGKHYFAYNSKFFLALLAR